MPRKRKIAKQVEVSVQKDHLRKLSNRRPLQAIEELVWNSLDADATRVEIVLEKNLWGGLQRIAIVDDGEGIRPARAVEAFEHLGGSWKQESPTTTGGRRLHGKEGKGRFAAFSLGTIASWTSIARDEEDQLHSLSVESSADKIDRFTITSTPIQPTKPPQQSGTTVTIDNVPESIHGLIGDKARATLRDRFALYLQAYPAVEIVYDDHKLDPSEVIAARERVEVEVEAAGERHAATVQIVEWKLKAAKGLFLCEPGGFARLELGLGIPTGDRKLSVYIESVAVEAMQHEGALELGDLHPLVRALAEAARTELGAYLERTAERSTGERVESWRQDHVYPFASEPSSPAERAQHQAFAAVASTLEQRLPELRRKKSRVKRLVFRLLRDAIEREPGDLHIALAEALELDADQDNALGAQLDASVAAKPKKTKRRRSTKSKSKSKAKAAAALA